MNDEFTHDQLSPKTTWEFTIHFTDHSQFQEIKHSSLLSWYNVPLRSNLHEETETHYETLPLWKLTSVTSHSRYFNLSPSGTFRSRELLFSTADPPVSDKTPVSCLGHVSGPWGRSHWLWSSRKMFEFQKDVGTLGPVFTVLLGPETVSSYNTFLLEPVL